MSKINFIYTFTILSCLLLTHQLSFDISLENKTPSIPFTSFAESLPGVEIEIEDDVLITSLCVGKSKDCYTVQIDLNSGITWIPHVENPQRKISKYDPSNYSSAKVSSDEDRYTYENGNIIKGYTIQDTLYFEDEKITNFKFISATSSDSFEAVEGILGLGPSQNTHLDKNYNFLHQLENKDIIKHKTFTIEFHKKKKGTLTIGKLPKEAKDDYQHYGLCSLIQLHLPIGDDIENPTSRIWACNVEGILLGSNPSQDKAIPVNKKYIRFDYTTTKSYLPITELLKLEKYYFKTQIDNGDCNFGIKNDLYTFTCYEDKHKEWSDLTLLFKEWGIVIPVEDLFIYDDKDNEYEFVFYAKDGYDAFTLGSNILKKFIMVFDESNDNIGFYNTDYVVKVSETAIQPPVTYEDDVNQPSQGEGGLIVNDKDKDVNNNKIPNVFPSGNENEHFVDNNNTPQFGFWSKLFRSVGIMLLIVVVLFIGWLGLRYYKRRKLTNPTKYYKVTEELFNEGTPLE